MARQACLLACLLATCACAAAASGIDVTIDFGSAVREVQEQLPNVEAWIGEQLCRGEARAKAAKELGGGSGSQFVFVCTGELAFIQPHCEGVKAVPRLGSKVPNTGLFVERVAGCGAMPADAPPQARLGVRAAGERLMARAAQRMHSRAGL